MVETRTGSYNATVDPGDELGSDRGLHIDAQGEAVDILWRGGDIRNVWIENVSISPAPITLRMDDGDTGQMLHSGVKTVDDNCLFGHEQHAGDALVRNVYLGDAREDLGYCSPMGNPRHDSGKANPGGQGGTVGFEQIIGEDAIDYGLRLGSEGSYVDGAILRNCGIVIANLYGLGDGVTFANVQGTGNNIGLKHIDHDPDNVGNWSERVVTKLDNVRLSAPQLTDENVAGGNDGTIMGEVLGNPDVSGTYPNVPMGPDEIAESNVGPDEELSFVGGGRQPTRAGAQQSGATDLLIAGLAFTAIKRYQESN